MTSKPKYLSLPFYNAPIMENEVTVGFVVGITLTHNGHTITKQTEAICGAEQASVLLTGSDEEFTMWSLNVLKENNLIDQCNEAMDALLEQK